LSTDDIVFDEVTYREPQRARRPDRDRAFACIAYELPTPQDLPIFLDKKPADAIERHALRDTSVELGGILLGRECVDDDTGEPFVRITEALEAKHYENTQASFTYTHDSWAEITRERDLVHPELDVVGWYHTHPDFGVFLSSHDLFIHHHFFGQPLQVAYVVDPIRQTRGFFRWRDGQVEQVGGFHVCSERTGRSSLARFVNDLENVPNPEGTGGTGLSPRLEAELIAMLTRPHTSVSTAAPSGQVAAAFTLLGVLLGVVMVAGAFWLQSLSVAVVEQTVALKDLRAAMNRDAEARPLQFDTERIRAKEAMLDALLPEITVGAKPARFLELYTHAVQERDRAQRAAATLATEKEALAALDTELKLKRDQFVSELAEKSKDGQRQEEELKTKNAEIEDLTARLKAFSLLAEESGSGLLARKYRNAWYAAAGAIGVSVLLALGLVAIVARDAPAPPEGEPRHAGA
jgi:proteasome lid subunit RPN8/RPN11